MAIEQFWKPGGRPVKVKVVGQPGIGFGIPGRDVFPGDVFETDEYTGRTYVNSGRCVYVEVEEPVAPPATEVDAPPAEAAGGSSPPEPDPPAQPAHEKKKK